MHSPVLNYLILFHSKLHNMASASPSFKHFMRNSRSKSEEGSQRILYKNETNCANTEIDLPSVEVNLSDHLIKFKEGNWDLQMDDNTEDVAENERLKKENTILQTKYDSLLNKLSEKSAYLNLLDKTIDELMESVKKIEEELAESSSTDENEN